MAIASGLGKEPAISRKWLTNCWSDNNFKLAGPASDRPSVSPLSLTSNATVRVPPPSMPRNNASARDMPRSISLSSPRFKTIQREVDLSHQITTLRLVSLVLVAALRPFCFINAAAPGDDPSYTHFLAAQTGQALLGAPCV